MDLTCIVLTHRSYREKAGSVELTTAAALAQEGVSFELVVVHNGDEPDDERRLQRFVEERAPGHVPARFLSVRTSIAGGRNAGARAARASTLVFLDDDTLLLDTHALATVARLARTHVHGYGARRLWTPPPPWSEHHGPRLRKAPQGGLRAALEGHLGVPHPALRGKQSPRFLMRTFVGNFGFVRRAELLGVGGFPESFTSYGYEDDALAAILYARFRSFASLASLTVAHVSHPCPAVADGALGRNRALYLQVLAALGARAFHVGDLLYPEDAPARDVLERDVLDGGDLRPARGTSRETA